LLPYTTNITKNFRNYKSREDKENSWQIQMAYLWYGWWHLGAKWYGGSWHPRAWVM